MTVNIIDILNFQVFYEKIRDKKLPIKTAYKFTKFFKKVDEEIIFYQTKLREIGELYGEKDENGQLVLIDGKNGIKIKDDKINECREEITALNTLEVEIDDISFSVEELDGLELTIEELYPISVFITE